MEVFQREFRRILRWGRLRRGLRFGIFGVLAVATISLVVRRIFGSFPPELTALGSGGFFVGIALPLAPERFLLRAGKRLGVGEALLGAWELARRGETVLLEKLAEVVELRELRPPRLLIPEKPELAVMAGVLAFLLAIYLLPPIRQDSPITLPHTELTSQDDVREKVQEESPEETRALRPDITEARSDAGLNALEEFVEGQLVGERGSPGGNPRAAEGTAEAPSGDIADREGKNRSPSGSPASQQARKEPSEVMGPAPPSLPLAEGTPPEDLSPGAAGRLGEAKSSASEGEGNEVKVFAPRAVPGPQAGSMAEAPWPSEEGGGELPPEGTAELAGKTPGEAPAVVEDRELWHITPPRATEVETRPGEGPVRTSALLSPPPEPSGDEAIPYIPPLGGVKISLGGRGLPPGAEELIRRYFLLLAREEVSG